MLASSTEVADRSHAGSGVAQPLSLHIAVESCQKRLVSVTQFETFTVCSVNARHCALNSDRIQLGTLQGSTPLATSAKDAVLIISWPQKYHCGQTGYRRYCGQRAGLGTCHVSSIHRIVAVEVKADQYTGPSTSGFNVLMCNYQCTRRPDGDKDMPSCEQIAPNADEHWDPL
jgi:hypothetical protein